MRDIRQEFSKYRQILQDLLETNDPQGEDQIFFDMLFNIGQLRDEKFDVFDLRLINTAFKELRYAMKVFKPYRNVPKAAVFGSARTPHSDPNFAFAQSFGKKLAKKGWMIITGGASGIMEAAMHGAGAKNSFGLNILLPFEQEANAIIKGNAKLVYFKYFFTRKLMFLKESEATVLFPGGFGTFDEGFESFTLVQTGKARPRPLVLMDTPGSQFWDSTLRLFRNNMEETGLISRGDLQLIRHLQDADAGVEEVTGFYKNYHSSRFYRDKYLIRVRNPIPTGVWRTLNTDFKDLLKSGKFEDASELGDDDVKDTALRRILFNFNKTNYNGLRRLIDFLNTL